ncbi:MAG: hypothetical protein ACE5H8_08925 [Alphaproteobacteria bacterium]
MPKNRNTLIVAAAVLVGVMGAPALLVLDHEPAAAHQQGKKLHLADAPPDQQVEAITYCDGTYRVITTDGSPVEYSEFDLRFKTDSGTDGPPTGIPVVINAGMRGDRGFVVFSTPGEISTFIKMACQSEM